MPEAGGVFVFNGLEDLLFERSVDGDVFVPEAFFFLEVGCGNCNGLGCCEWFDVGSGSWIVWNDNYVEMKSRCDAVNHSRRVEDERRRQ